MGFILNVDLETSEGPSHEVYVRVESLNYNKVVNEVSFQLTYWLDQSYALAFNRAYLDEETKNAVGLVQERLLYYKDNDSEGEEILLPHFVRVNVSTRKEIKIPIYEEKEIKKEVPYTSFDEEGDELTLYRTVTIKEKVEVGVKLEEKDVVDTTLLDNMFGFVYSEIKKELTKWFPDKSIEIR
jgi:hypothetical protein